MDKDAIAKKTANILLKTESIKIAIDDPFTYVSGRKGPVYTDCRRPISFVEERNQLMDFGAEMLRQTGDSIDIVAGGETAGIPYAAFIAERLQTPMVYVRKKPKGYGRMAQIEGEMREGRTPNIALVEDLQTDGGSKRVFIDALRDAGATVKHAFVIFHYGIFEASEKNMADMGITLHALCNWWDVLALMKSEGTHDTSTIDSLESFLNDPIAWSVARGGAGEENAA